MKTKIILNLLALAAISNASTTITSANVLEFKDENGGDLGTGVLGLVVIDTGNDGFGTLRPGSYQIGSTLGDDDFVGDGNDLVVKVVDSTDFPSIAIQGGFNTSLSNSTPPGIPSTNNQFLVYWFPTLSSSGDKTLRSGDVYGSAREANWFLGNDGDTKTVSTVNNAGNANFTVGPIPEPSSTALLGLGGLALLTRRRRA